MHPLPIRARAFLLIWHHAPNHNAEACTIPGDTISLAPESKLTTWPGAANLANFSISGLNLIVSPSIYVHLLASPFETATLDM